MHRLLTLGGDSSRVWSVRCQERHSKRSRFQRRVSRLPAFRRPRCPLGCPEGGGRQVTREKVWKKNDDAEGVPIAPRDSRC